MKKIYMPNEAQTSVGVKLTTLLVWLVSIGLALPAIYVLYGVLTLVFVLTGAELKAVEVARLVILLILGVTAVGFVIGSGEYHRKHTGSAKSIRMFVITFVTLGLIALSSMFL